MKFDDLKDYEESERIAARIAAALIDIPIFIGELMMNYEMMEMDELLAERNAIDEEIVLRADEELATIETRRAQLLSIVGKSKAEKPPKKPRSSCTPRYRNPDDPAETWSGRGPKPKWMKEWLAAMKDPTDLMIPA